MITKEDLTNELTTKFADLSWDDWDRKCKSRGTHVKKDYQLDRLEDHLVEKINRTQDLLEITQLRPFLTADQKSWYEQNIKKIKAEIAEKRALRAVAATKDEKKALIEEQERLFYQLDILIDEYEREDRSHYFKNKVDRLKDKFACVIKEKEIREKKLFPRSPIGTTYYLDFNGNTGTLTGTWTFTNASATVSGSGGAATSELATGNYIRVSNGTEWYKITGITDDNTITISPAFQQDTVTDSAGATQYNNYDGTATTTPFVHLNQYTTDTVRNAGDILKVRANQTHHYDGIDINFDEKGTADNLLTVKSCSTADDPWGDGSDVKPIISFGDTAYNMNLNYDDYWKLARLEVIESGDSNGAVSINGGAVTHLVDCVVRDNDPSGKGLKFQYNRLEIDGCEFYSNLTYSIYAVNGFLHIKDSVFNGGSVTTDRGLQLTSCVVDMENTTFGVTTTHDVADLASQYSSSIIYNRNCKFASGTEFKQDSYNKGIYSEDHNQTKGDQKRVTYNGTVTKDTGTVHSGGASSSAKLEPNSYCGLYYPLTISDDFAGDFKLWLPASQKTITIYLQTFGYTTLPTADELYIEASYLDESSGGHRATIKSTDTVSANGSWTGFSVTFTPSQEGWVYVTVYLKKYESSSGAYVDIKPVIS